MANGRQIYHNISIMQNITDSELPLPLQHAIAACCSIIREYFAPRTNSFILSTHVQETRLNVHVRDFLNQVLLCLNMIKVEIEDIDAERGPSFNRKFNLIVVDGPESLRQLNPGKLSRDYDIQENYLLYLMHASRFSNIPEVLHEMFSYFWKNYIINVSIIEVNNINQSVDAFTYYPFYGRQSCKMVYVEMINSFSGTWLKSLESYMFPEKLENLHTCPINVAVWDTPPYLSYVRTTNGFYEISDFEADMLKVLAENLNFTLDLMEPPNNEQRGKVLANGSTTGALRMLQDRIADLSLGSFRYTLERSELLTAALPYYQTWQIYGVLRRGDPYTSLQILVYAFDEKTWLCLYLSIQVALIIAYVIQFNYNKSILARIILGFPRTQTPLMNIFRIFMGESMTTLPHSKFTRFIIILWLFYGVLLKTAYQSLLFQLLRGDLYHQPPQSLTDLIDNNCKLVLTEGTFDSVVTVPRIAQGLIDVVKIKNTSEQSTLFYVEEHKESQCFAGITPQDFLIYHVLMEKKMGDFYILPEKIFTQHVTMYFTKHSFLINRFNFMFMNLRSMGLIDFWASKILDMRYFRDGHEAKYKPISIFNLNGIFIIYAALVLLAMVIFCIELSLLRLRNIFYRRPNVYIK